MKRTGALVTLSLSFIPSIPTTNSQSTAQLSTSFSLLLRVAAREPPTDLQTEFRSKPLQRASAAAFARPLKSQFAVKASGKSFGASTFSTSTIPAPLPAVDFDKEMVAAVFLGEKPTGGYGVEISSAEVADRSLTVFVRETSPKPGAMVTQAINQPFHIVRIEAAGVETVSFRRAP